MFHVCVSSVQTLTTGLAEQVKRERARLEMELKQAADKAVHAVQKWYGYKLSRSIYILKALL